MPDRSAIKSEAAELYDEILGHIFTLSEGNDLRDDREIKNDVAKRIARLIRAKFEHEINNLRTEDFERGPEERGKRKTLFGD